MGDITDMGSEPLVASLPPSITSLSLSVGCRSVSDGTLFALAAALPPSLKSLSVRLSSLPGDAGVTDAGVTHLCAVCPATLDSLWLRILFAPYVTDRSLQAIAPITKQLTSMRLFFEAPITEDAVFEFCQVLNEKMTDVELGFLRTDSGSLRRIVEQLPVGLMRIAICFYDVYLTGRSVEDVLEQIDALVKERGIRGTLRHSVSALSP